MKYPIKLSLFAGFLILLQWGSVWLANEQLLGQLSFTVIQLLLVCTALWISYQFITYHQAKREYNRGVQIISQRLNQANLRSLYGEIEKRWYIKKFGDKDVVVFEQKRHKLR